MAASTREEIIKMCRCVREGGREGGRGRERREREGGRECIW